MQWISHVLAWQRKAFSTWHHPRSYSSLPHTSPLQPCSASRQAFSLPGSHSSSPPSGKMLLSIHPVQTAVTPWYLPWTILSEVLLNSYWSWFKFYYLVPFFYTMTSIYPTRLWVSCSYLNSWRLLHSLRFIEMPKSVIYLFNTCFNYQMIYDIAPLPQGIPIAFHKKNNFKIF